MLRRVISRVRRLIVGPPAAQGRTLMPRMTGLDEELKFWRTWFETKGGNWPDDYRRRFDPALPLQDELARLALANPSPTIDVLDVGAGPVTRLGKFLPGKTLRLVPTDFLAREYNKLLDELNVQPLLKTTFADAEHLAEQFGPNRFDLVHAQNTVDHMERAERAIEQMIAVLRPGGTLYLRHEEHEGRNNDYFSIHHWDFWLDDTTGHFMIQHVNARPIDVTVRTRGLGKSTTYREGKRVVFELTKRQPASLPNGKGSHA